MINYYFDYQCQIRRLLGRKIVKFTLKASPKYMRKGRSSNLWMFVTNLNPYPNLSINLYINLSVCITIYQFIYLYLPHYIQSLNLGFEIMLF